MSVGRDGNAARRHTASRLVAGYYLATPLFAVVDLAAGAPVRVSGVLPGWGRGAYYAVLLLLGFLCRARPAATPWVGMAESSVNIFLLLLGILLPVWSMTDAVLAGAPLRGGLTPAAAGNALLAGGALVMSFHRHKRAALGHDRAEAMGWRRWL